MDLFFIRGYQFGASGGSFFVFYDGYIKVGVGPRSNHLIYRKYYCFIYGGSFMSSWSSDSLLKIHYNKDRSYSLLSWKSNDRFSSDGNGVGGVCTKTTHFSSQKVDFG